MMDLHKPKGLMSSRLRSWPGSRGVGLAPAPEEGEQERRVEGARFGFVKSDSSVPLNRLRLSLHGAGAQALANAPFPTPPCPRLPGLGSRKSQAEVSDKM
ncbi:hypothetical protein P7K49_032521 [Saguinus oedipus]|uniref:Uncharacterized protein n=1 Tax=Saguinus oedipus TaxID=9490 RepID=A0ABQ9TYG5_SAGOE|nr:hypothetical protein P7K49_032521 [Saguinus oedipus]